MALRALLIGPAIGAVAAGALLSSAIEDGGPPARPSAAPCLFAFLSRLEADRHVERLREAARDVSVVAPNWYRVGSGRSPRVDGGADPRVLRIARSERIAVWPVVNARLGFRPAFARAATRRRLARSIAATAARGRFDGITLDIEEIAPSERVAFVALVDEVAARLHAAGRRLAVYVPRRTAARVTRSAAAYDWRALARSADLVLASGYNEHSAGTGPGPITTTSGFRDLLRYAGAVSRRRVAPAIGAFGYAWPLGGDGPGRLVASREAELGSAGAIDGSRRLGGARTYRAGGEEVWYETAAGLARRVRAARRARFRWVALFSLGREPEGAIRLMRVSGRCGPSASAR